MKAVLGLVSLLVVLAVIGLIASRQLRSTPLVDRTAATAAGLPPAQATPSGTPDQQAQQLKQQITNDLNKAMEQGAARADEADKP
jgi:hypothetical protein